MRELAYLEERNLLIEWRFADGKYERFPELLAELIRIPVDVIVTDGTPSTLAAKKATKTIPIVFGSSGDPVGTKLVESLARPGGNATGLSLLSLDLSGKQLEMLRRILPGLSRVGVLLNPQNAYSARGLEGLQRAAPAMKIQLFPMEVRSAQEIDDAFTAMVKEQLGAFIYISDSFPYERRFQMAELSLRHRIPGMAGARPFPEAGGLIGYGQNQVETYRRAASYIEPVPFSVFSTGRMVRGVHRA